MGITCHELDGLNLTASEFDSLDITCEQFDNMTYKDFLGLLSEKLAKFKELPPDHPISAEVNSKIDKIYQTAASELPGLAIAPQKEWSKQPAEILFEAICNALVAGAVAQLPHLIASIISVINRLLN